ncbi:unnamed protein product [Urochloa decumbens]|uniref:Uncharacterized protein n=1 Tax=Urochloa decumbens TaxID=240449 RepID=A0ABC9F3G0_9POAL
MKSSGVVLVLLLAISMASCRLSLAVTAAAAGHESGASIRDILGRELRGFIARAGNMFRSAGAAGWRAAADAEAKNMRAVAAARRRRPTRKSAAAGGGGGGGARCVSAAACRKRRVICAKRCYRASRAARLTHVASRCVVKCRKCVPTC